MSINEVKNVDGPEPPVEKLIPQRLISPCSKQEWSEWGGDGGGRREEDTWSDLGDPAEAPLLFVLWNGCTLFPWSWHPVTVCPRAFKSIYFLLLVSRLLISEMCLFLCFPHNPKCRFNQMGFQRFLIKNTVLIFALRVDRVTTWRGNTENPWACLAKLDSLPWATYPFAFIVSEKSQFSFRSA